jgi:dihydrofolate reductase
MGKLIEAVHVTLGGEVGTTTWARPYLDDQHGRYAMELLTAADALLLGRLTYEGLSAAYTRMAEEAPAGVPTDFIDRMNRIPKFVASSTLRELTWNATAIDGDVVRSVDDLKHRAGLNLLKYGHGALDATLMEHGLIDEFHLFLTPVAIGQGKHLFESLDAGEYRHLSLVDVKRFDSGVLTLVYEPKR